MLFLYRICGLIVRSNVKIPLLPQLKNIEQDVEVKFVFMKEVKSFSSSSAINNPANLYYRTYKLAGKYLLELRNPDLNVEVSLDGSEVICMLSECTGIERAILDFLGCVFSFVLNLKNHLCLHASAVCIENKVVAFLGESGAGKSTISHNLSTFNYIEHFTDDILPVAVRNSNIYSVPSYPLIKMKRELIPHNINSISVPGNDFKRQIYTGDLLKYSIEKKDLSILILLNRNSEDSAIKFDKLPENFAYIMLLKNIYGVELLTKTQLSNNSSFIRQIISKIPIYQLSYPNGIEYLPSVFEELFTMMKLY